MPATVTNALWVAGSTTRGCQLHWADLVVVMEKAHRTKLRRGYARALGSTRVVCLDIPDRYAFMEPALIELLEARMRPHLPGR